MVKANAEKQSAASSIADILAGGVLVFMTIVQRCFASKLVVAEEQTIHASYREESCIDSYPSEMSGVPESPNLVSYLFPRNWRRRLREGSFNPRRSWKISQEEWLLKIVSRVRFWTHGVLDEVRSTVTVVRFWMKISNHNFAQTAEALVMVGFGDVDSRFKHIHVTSILPG